MDVSGVEGALSIYYENPLNYVIENVEREVGEEDIEEGLGVLVVVTGGTSSPEGFEELFRHHLEDSTIPFLISEVRSINHPLYNITHGSFVTARPEKESDGGASDPEPEAEATPGSN